uniref:low-density lipoprotein receptor-related protein 5-like n=1 Tax=Styela clava TaxID=7725 RepID=UPI00193A80B5|nr:low-density lipoprotein receptor-related protein 5-like [Styela clava]
MLNQTTDLKEVLETASPTTTSPPLSQDIHILIGRRSSLSVISILSTSGVSYEQYGINVTDLIAIDYDPVEKYIYWTGKGYIRRAKTNFTVGELLASNLSTEVDGVAVDWVARNMYWSDKGLKLIGVSRLDGSSKKNFITTNIEAPRAIVLYPSIGKMYWSDWGSKPKIEATSLDGTDRHILVNGSLMWPNGLAIDYARNFLYWVDAGLDRIEAIQLDGSGRSVLIAHDHHIFGFTYFQNFIYWTDWQTGSLDRMLVYNSTIRQNIASGAGDFMGVKVYGNHAIPQTNQCYGNNNGCSHLCFYTSNGAVCDCPQSWGLKSDKKTCISP